MLNGGEGHIFVQGMLVDQAPLEIKDDPDLCAVLDRSVRIRPRPVLKDGGAWRDVEAWRFGSARREPGKLT